MAKTSLPRSHGPLIFKGRGNSHANAMRTKFTTQALVKIFGPIPSLVKIYKTSL